ncbi:hypothetical protein SCOCK_60186 [Actinacidiphila cocklensis]|uniref:Uncharacterized protein n=1 Tax=Actinacidiphila cocklensis TaxID=887465 RepID=A0A9W4DXT6_9ACTN|nr:hypothetical protein SCOCK_60186 [Actinacidiphila cocklensis]
MDRAKVGRRPWRSLALGSATGPHPHHTQRYGTVSHGRQRHRSDARFGTERAADQHACRQGTCDSQAQSAGSIPVIRSNTKPQVSSLGLICCLAQFKDRAPLAHHIGRSIGATRRSKSESRMLIRDSSRIARRTSCDVHH